ncbi:winged helix-turn-helix domain-containing protein [Colwellia sp. MB02u-14]|uniref:winged helix-turn-helix domain-containing protein n=1 Tax=Colwellia sp. MB02u-14 TaxID=2759815 RepID=UPI0015F61B05|nr:winged helix-turn-helix domain-containing protein [Colwellia sp. MB02u-14]MBA6304477.1 winged helix-turn-helix domain-containing protein [Colwellia sp. MB02u-14]
MAVHIANVIFDVKQRILKNGTQSRNLEPKVFNLLTTLLAADGQIVTRDQLIVKVWNNRIVGDGAINRTVSLLRGHFSALTDEAVVETVQTQGYRLIAKVLETEQETTEVETKSAKNAPVIKAMFSLKSISFMVIALLVIIALLVNMVFLNDSFKLNSFTHQSNLSLVSGPLIGLKGWEYQLSTTESGDKILFHHLDENNKQSVYLYDSKTHTKQLVLMNAFAAINGNGKNIVFSTTIDNQCSMAVYDVLTKEKHTLFTCDEPPTSLVWGQNDTFYFNKRFSKSHPYQVFSYNIKTSRLRQITNPSSKDNTKGDFHFSYNSQNNHLAIIRYINENKSKIIINEAEFQVAEYTVDLRVSNLVWHPNKSALIIADNNNLYVLNADSRYQPLKQLAFKINSLAVIPCMKAPSLLVSSSSIVSEIVKYDIHNNRDVVWQQSARAELLPRMQANTKLVLSTRYKSHHWWKIEGSEATLIDVKLPFDLQFVRYELSDDGKRVLFTKHGVVFELDLEKGVSEAVFSEPKSSYVANYDKRNKEDIIYSSNHSGHWQLWLYQRATNKHSQLTYSGGYSGRIIGQYLYYSKFTVDGLWRKKLAEPTEWLVIEDFNRINWLNWQVINNQLYFYRKATGIWQHDIETGEEQLLMTKPHDFVHQYVVSPDQLNIFWVRLKPIEGDIYQYEF